MTTPADPLLAQQQAALRAARTRSLLALLFVLVGITAATVGAGLAWGLAIALVVLGGCLFALGVLVAVIG